MQMGENSSFVVNGLLIILMVLFEFCLILPDFQYYIRSKAARNSLARNAHDLYKLIYAAY